MEDGAIALANSLRNENNDNFDSEDRTRQAFIKQSDATSNHIHSHISISEASTMSSQKLILKKLILLGNRVSSLGIEKLVHSVLTEDCPVKYLNLKQNKIDQTTKNKLILVIDHFNNRAQKIYDHAIASVLVTSRDKIGATIEVDSVTSTDKSKLVKKQPSFLTRKQSFVGGKKEVTHDSLVSQTEQSVLINHTKHIYL